VAIRSEAVVKANANVLPQIYVQFAKSCSAQSLVPVNQVEESSFDINRTDTWFNVQGKGATNV
jgi:hypothetical protein